MIITRKAIPRRTVLRGLGATLALPLLDGMVPALTAQARTAAAPINRFGVMYVVNGMIMQNWTPAAEGGEAVSPGGVTGAPVDDVDVVPADEVFLQGGEDPGVGVLDPALHLDALPLTEAVPLVVGVNPVARTVRSLAKNRRPDHGGRHARRRVPRLDVIQRGAHHVPNSPRVVAG